MNVENQILGIIKIQGRITALGGEIGRASEVVNQTGASVVGADEERAEFVDAREEARCVWRDAKDMVSGAESAVHNAQLALKEAKGISLKAEREFAAFTDETLIELNEVITKRSELLSEANAKVCSLEKELEASQETLQEKQEALKEEGYELNIGVPRPPKTTFL